MRRALLAAFGGVAIGLGGAPTELSLVTMLAPAAFLLAVEPSPGAAVSLRASLWLGLLTGGVANLYSMYWVVELLMEFGSFPLVAALPTGALLWVGQSLGWVTAGGVTVTLIRRGLPGWIVLPLALVVAHTLAPAIFPWRYGLSQLGFLPYAQVAELGGLPLLDGLVAFVGCGIVTGLRTSRRAPLVVAAIALAGPPSYGALRMHQVAHQRETAPAIAVGIVQPNVGIHDKHDPRQHVDHLRQLRAMTAALEADGASLVVWPESSYPFPVHRGARRERGGPLGLLSDGVRGPLIVGVLTTDGAPFTAAASDAEGRLAGTFTLGTGDRYNSAIAVARGGEVTGIADKVRLLAFGEYTPLWDVVPWLQVFPRGLTPGEGAQIVEVAGARVGVLNCYEDLLADHVREQAQAAPDFWANVTNNAWFGDTTAPHLHHMNARLRAIETRRDLVRAVNTGVSGHTAATGEDLARTDSFVQASFVADVRILEGATPWVSIGDWVTPFCGAWLLSLIWLSFRRGQRQRTRGSTSASSRTR